MNEVSQRGLELFADIMGAEHASTIETLMKGGGLMGSMASLAVDYAFGSVWSRDGLERRQRSLVVIGILIAQGQSAELRNHFRIALTNGLEPRELEEAVIQTVPYVGLPLASQATSALVEILRERGLSTDEQTAEERGLV